MKNQKWSDYEITQLTNNYSKYNNYHLSSMIGRSIGAIEHKAARLGLQKSDEFMKSCKSGRFHSHKTLFHKIKDFIRNKIATWK